MNPFFGNKHPSLDQKIYHYIFFVSGHSVLVTDLFPHPTEGWLSGKTFSGPTFDASTAGGDIMINMSNVLYQTCVTEESAKTIVADLKQRAKERDELYAKQKAAFNAAAKQGTEGEEWKQSDG